MTRSALENRVVVRGAGEMASGVIRRLFLAGFKVTALEQAAPDCIRRTVCYAEAVYEKQVTVERVKAVLTASAAHALELVADNCVPVLVDPRAESLSALEPHVLIDGRMQKRDIDTQISMAPIVIGLGPGFVAGQNCHAAVESNRGHNLGRVLYQGAPEAYTGQPAPVDGFDLQRLLLAPDEGTFRAERRIGDSVEVGQTVGMVGESAIVSGITGIVRGLLRDGLSVVTGQKIGDVDPRGIKEYCFSVSDKANAVAGGVLEAVLALQKRLD